MKIAVLSGKGAQENNWASLAASLPACQYMGVMEEPNGYIFQPRN